MKITFILPGYSYFPVGGFRIVYLYANFLADHGHDVQIVHAIKAGPITYPTPSWPRFLRIGWRRLLYKYRASHPPTVSWQYIDPRIHLIYTPGEPSERFIPDGDVVIATAWWTADYVYSYNRSKGQKYYLIQGWEEFLGASNKTIERTWLLPLEKIVIAQWLLAKGESIGATHMHHISNGIDLNVFKMNIPIPERQPSILTLYHTSKLKGTDDALSALAKLHTNFSKVKITMFGAQKPSINLPKWITFVYNPSPQQLVNLYNTHTIYLAASHSEGWALPPAEAMACGCTVVATDVGGFQEYIIPHVTGLVSPIRDPDALYANVEILLKNPQFCQQLQSAAHQHIQNFSVASMGLSLENLLLSQYRGVV